MERLFEYVGKNDYVNRKTGEIVDDKEVLEILREEKKIKNDLIESEIKLIKENNGIKERKDTHYLNWNNNKGNPTLFTKNYKIFQKENLKNMDIFEKGVMATLTPYIETETNKIIIDGKSPSNKELQNMTGLGASKLKEVLASLRDKNLIVTQGRGMGRSIYINPMWAFDGKDMNRDILNLFNINNF